MNIFAQRFMSVCGVVLLLAGCVGVDHEVERIANLEIDPVESSFVVRENQHGHSLIVSRESDGRIFRALCVGMMCDHKVGESVMLSNMRYYAALGYPTNVIVVEVRW